MNNPEKMDDINFDDFTKIDMRAGKIISVKDNEKAHKPSYILEVDLGEKIGIKKSSAQITNYSKDELINKYVICVVNFPPKRIAGHKSEVLVLGVDNEMDEVILLTPDKEIPPGNRVY
ncbi:MAG: tRNA-binding protein [Spirochaetota bacterium]